MKYLILLTACVYLLLGFIVWEVLRSRPLSPATRDLMESLSNQLFINQQLLDLHRAQIGTMVSLIDYTESQYDLLKKRIVMEDEFFSTHIIDR